MYTVYKWYEQNFSLLKITSHCGFSWLEHILSGCWVCFTHVLVIVYSHMSNLCSQSWVSFTQHHLFYSVHRSISTQAIEFVLLNIDASVASIIGVIVKSTYSTFWDFLLGFFCIANPTSSKCLFWISVVSLFLAPLVYFV